MSWPTDKEGLGDNLGTSFLFFQENQRDLLQNSILFPRSSLTTFVSSSTFSPSLKTGHDSDA